MNKREYLINLYVIYGELLTEKQKNIFTDYYYEDLSLSEISENMNISRSYVSKSLQVVSTKLEEFESKLKCYEKYETVKKIVMGSSVESEVIKKINE